MSTTDRVSPELRKAEKEIDNCYKSNPLVKLPFATAAWSFMTFTEEAIFKQTTGQITSHELGNLYDNFINELKYPMSWLYRACNPGGQIFSTCNANLNNASSNLLKTGQKYRWFHVAFICHIHEELKLEIQGQTIQPVGDFFRNIEMGIEYEAYNGLINSQKLQEAPTMVDPDAFPIDLPEHSVKIKGDRFDYKLNHKMISNMVKYLEPLLDKMFLLPSEWHFGRYSLGDFRKVYEAILSMAVIRRNAKIIAIKKGCQNMGYLDSIYLPTYNELLRRVVRYSDLSDKMVQNVFDDLTYGSRDIKNPDPAIQPLIKLNSQCYAIMPHLWLFSAAERNLTVLLNKFPLEKKVYLELASEKEKLMYERFDRALSDKGFRFVRGSVANLPDVDLAIVNDTEKACLLLELKWFIDPAEAREIIHKSKEIEKGISQVLKLKRAFHDNCRPLLDKLEIDSNYRLEGIVVSENWIGNAVVQSPEVPVIRTDHIIAKLKSTDNLQSTIEWLRNREYLPKEGKHFKIIRKTYTIGKWYLKWYRIKPFIKDAFFPL